TNANIHIARLMIDHGAGCDVTSAGELFRALKAGCPSERIVFAGVGKTDAELKYALDSNILFFHVESEGELLALGEVAKSLGNAGLLVSRVIYTKESGGKSFVIQDAAMNDLIRPTLYDSFHRIWPVAPAAGLPAPPEDYEAAIPGTQRCDVVGPVCESGDFLA